jgi:hypothetical protein
MAAADTIRGVAVALVAAALAGPLAAPTSGQSAAASLSGTVRDPHGLALSGARVTLTALGTGATRTAVTDGLGNYHMPGLPAGEYVLSVGHHGFDPTARELRLGVAERRRIDVVLAVAGPAATLEVAAATLDAGAGPGTLGRIVRPEEIDALPAASRDFTTLALLVPGITRNAISPLAASTALSANGQSGRSNLFLLDGLTLDDAQLGNVRSGVPVDAVQEFAAFSAGTPAEYGQGAGATVQVITRSGGNDSSGRAYYFHRDSAWDATSGSAALAGLDDDVARGWTAGGTAGGPLRQDRAFLFGAVERQESRTDAVITSPVFALHYPGVSPLIPTRSTSTDLFLRNDVRAGASNLLTARGRLRRAPIDNRVGDADRRIGAPERRQDAFLEDGDVGMSGAFVLRGGWLVEVRSQVARRAFDLRSVEQAGAPAVERPSLLQGPQPSLPNDVVEDRRQAAASLTVPLRGRWGDHSLKAGFDVSDIDVAFDSLANAGGVFRFNTDDLFDPSRAATYPVRYRQAFGPSRVDVPDTRLALFAQDQWRLGPRATLDAGLRWDHASNLALDDDRDNLAARVHLAAGPAWREGALSVRGGYGRYVDELPLVILRNAVQGAQEIVAAAPGFPDWTGFNPIRPFPVQTLTSTTRLSASLDTPFADQASAGAEVRVGRAVRVSADGVWARSYRLPLTLDANYPDLSGGSLRPQRPDPALEQVRVVETRGHAWYRGLLVGAHRPVTGRYGFSAAYTWSRTIRDTEDFAFQPQDHRDPAAERAPSLGDARHQFSGSLVWRLPWDLQASAVAWARSGLPWNATVGRDDNRDGNPDTDRPAGESRNARRGDPAWQVDVRLSKHISAGPGRVEILLEALNVFNHRNWVDVAGNRSSPVFGRPRAALAPRQLQVGLRATF